MNKLLSSKPITDKYYETIQTQLKNISEKPSLAILLVGDKKDSLTYIQLKRKKCDELGIKSYLHTFTDKCSVNGIIHLIQMLNDNKDINGIIVQLPLPEFYSESDEYRILNSVNPEKDIDGFHLLNVGNLTLNTPKFIPCTAEGCYELLKYYQIPIKGKHIVIIGSSKVVGLPLSLLLLHRNATVTICHSRTKGLENHIRSADIIVGAVGIPKFIQGDWIKDGAIVIDAGYHPEQCGDIDLESCAERTVAYTPVPGGVGPMTINTLILQTIEACESKV